MVGNRKSAVTIGDFDGVHIGHAALIHKLCSEADRRGLGKNVISFSNNSKGSKVLCAKDEKLKLLYGLGADNVWTPEFSDIKSKTAGEFVDDILADRFDAKVVVCGEDFRFGSGRAGDASLLCELLKKHGADCIVVPPVTLGGEVVSSSAIRKAIASGEAGKAAEMLGRRFSFTLTVSEGAHIGRKLGYPTVNQIYPDEMVKPAYGVYAVLCGIEGKSYGGVANIGVKPTVTDSGVTVCETYLFGFAGDAYGTAATVSLLEFLRPEKRFDSIELLKAQIENDVAAAHTAIGEICE